MRKYHGTVFVVIIFVGSLIQLVSRYPWVPAVKSKSDLYFVSLVLSSYTHLVLYDRNSMTTSWLLQRFLFYLVIGLELYHFRHPPIQHLPSYTTSHLSCLCWSLWWIAGRRVTSRVGYFMWKDTCSASSFGLISSVFCQWFLTWSGLHHYLEWEAWQRLEVVLVPRREKLERLGQKQAVLSGWQDWFV